jgi:hypothetical protein
MIQSAGILHAHHAGETPALLILLQVLYFRKLFPSITEIFLLLANRRRVNYTASFF